MFSLISSATWNFLFIAYFQLILHPDSLAINPRAKRDNKRTLLCNMPINGCCKCFNHSWEISAQHMALLVANNIDWKLLISIWFSAFMFLLLLLPPQFATKLMGSFAVMINLEEKCFLAKAMDLSRSAVCLDTSAWPCGQRVSDTQNQKWCLPPIGSWKMVAIDSLWPPERTKKANLENKLEIDKNTAWRHTTTTYTNKKPCHSSLLL